MKLMNIDTMTERLLPRSEDLPVGSARRRKHAKAYTPAGYIFTGEVAWAFL